MVLSVQNRQMATAARPRHPGLLKHGKQKSSKQGLYLIAIAVGMVGVTYASVPLYRCV